MVGSKLSDCTKSANNAWKSSTHCPHGEGSKNVVLKHNVGRNKDRDLSDFYSTPEIYTWWLLENEDFDGIIADSPR